MNIELELCPFCGETVGIQILTTGDTKDPIGYGSVIKGQVLCSSRNCLLEEFSHRKYYSGGFKLQSEDHNNYQREVSEYIATAWNTRISKLCEHEDENPPLLDKQLTEEAEIIMEAGVGAKLKTSNNLFKTIALMAASGNCTKNKIEQIYNLAKKGLKESKL